MRKVTKVKIESTNPDYQGSWTKADIEEEMREVDMEITSPSDWLDYLFAHVFEGYDYEGVEAARLESVKSISFYLDNDFVKIEKTF